jgi:tetratricopeptide (TPR) repeat protein
MSYQPVSALEYSRAVALLAIAGPLPEHNRWGRRIIANAFRVATRCLAWGAPAKAKSLMEIVARAAPTLPFAQILRAQAAYASFDFDTVEQAITAAMSAGPLRPAEAGRLAGLKLWMDDSESARLMLESAKERYPTSYRLWRRIGMTYKAEAQFTEAIECFERLARVTPRPSERLIAKLLVAECLESGGERDAAVERYRAIIAEFPTDARAYCRLAHCLPNLDADSELAESLLAILPSLGGRQRASAHYALGQLYDKSGRYGDAFAHFHLGSDLRSRSVPMGNIDELRETVEARIDIFRTDLIARLSRYGSQDDSLVFIAGMPRSGTTLLEQILSSHSEVQGLGERQDIWQTVQGLPWKIRSKTKYPWCVTQLSGECVQSISRSLLEKRRDAVGQCRRIVTKCPADVWDLGLISILFPRARIIDCRRDSIDACLSCYMQDFVAVGYAVSLDMLAEVHLSYRRLMEHWRAVLPSSMFEVKYEELVTRPSELIPDLCRFCGLEYEERCAQFHENRKHVDTASRWQVREPLYSTSVRRWERYRPFLGPLLALQERALDTDNSFDQTTNEAPNTSMLAAQR